MEEMKFESPSTTVMLQDIANYRGKDVLTAYLKYVEAVNFPCLFSIEGLLLRPSKVVMCTCRGVPSAGLAGGIQSGSLLILTVQTCFGKAVRAAATFASGKTAFGTYGQVISMERSHKNSEMGRCECAS